ncbi:MAG: ABC transporter ATP-binding protein [Clostridia bacterium]|nr:ABC transporter ATP-binding protein [Clostridia bacterium]
MSVRDHKTVRQAVPRPAGPGHGPGGGVPIGKAKDFKGTLKKLLHYIGRYKGSVILVAVFAVVASVLAVLGPRILGFATTRLFQDLMGMVEGTTDAINMTYIGQVLMVLIGLYIVSSFCLYIQGFVMSKVTMKVTYNMRRDVSKKLNRLPLSFFDKQTYGEVLSLITNDIDTINQNLNQVLTQIITSVTTVVGTVVIMLTMNWGMTLIVLLILPISLAIVSVVVRKSQRYFSAQQDYLGHVNAHVEEVFTNHTVVKAFNGEEDEAQKFDVMNGELYSAAWRSQFMSGLMMPIMNFVANLGYVGLCIMGGYLAMHGSLTVGEIQAFLQYVRNITQPIVALAQISAVLQMTMAAAERVFAFLAEPDETPDPAIPEHIGDIKGAVDFDHISFGYNPDKLIIKDFSCHVKPGQKVAIVGPTGAGKTTLVKLLMRFYELDGGCILIDGINTQKMTRDELRSLFGMVLQDAWLESTSIAENIRYGRLDASDEEVRKAAKAAQADHFVRTLAEGYETAVNEESSNISQGQKQLLTIARVILADPKMLILDEATSSVDTRTEVQIQKAMDNLMKGRTSFVIAHRLSTIRNADLILVMRDGDIVEQGTHDELLKKRGFYADLYNSQFEKAA